MAAEHWFDIVHKTLAQKASRRGALGAAITLIAALVTNDTRVTQAKRNKKKRRKDKTKANKKKDKPQADPAQTCSGGACAAVQEWAGDQTQINFCEFVCQQCDGDDPRQFCIVDDFKFGGTRTKVADCCEEDEACCEGLCVDTTSDPDHCNGCNQRCPIGASCVNGGCRCPEGHSVCGNTCQECCIDLDCDNNMDCLDGVCGCGPSTKLCDGACILESDCCTDADCPNLFYTCQPCAGGGLSRCCGLPPRS